MEARIEQVVSAVNTWIVGDDEEVIVVDPGTDPAVVLAATADREILAVICTHGHASHVTAALDVAARDEAPVALNPKDLLRGGRRTMTATRRSRWRMAGSSRCPTSRWR